jgi:hypothetical protein
MRDREASPHLSLLEELFGVGLAGKQRLYLFSERFISCADFIEIGLALFWLQIQSGIVNAFGYLKPITHHAGTPRALR